VADEGIKKAIVKKASLPAISGSNQSYVLRYRIITEDKNRTSHWSPRYNLFIGPITKITEANRSIEIAGSTNTKTLRLNWNTPQDININTFDVYAKINSGSYQYKGVVSTNSYSLIIETGNQVSLAIQIPTYPKKRFTSATLLEVTNINV